MGYELRNYQKECANEIVDYCTHKHSRNGVVQLPTGCHEKGYKILMYDGTLKNVEDIVVGDELISPSSEKRTVLRLHNGTDEMYKVYPIKGIPFIVNKDHILSLYKTRSGFKYPSDEPCYTEISVIDYVSKGKTYKHVHKLYKPEIVDFKKNDTELILEPYFLGIFLGDGSSANGSISVTTMRSEIVSYLYKFAEENDMKLACREKSNGTNKAKSYFFSKISGNSLLKSNLGNKLVELGLFKHTAGDKFIPQQYLSSSIENRFELLAGLLDTDAYYDEKRRGYEYCTKSKVMALQIEFLCRTLGFMANIGKVKIVNDVEYYRMQISGDCERIPTRVAIRKGSKREQIKSEFVTGFKIEKAGIGDYYGFELDGDHLYLDHQLFTHHNSGKSIIIANVAKQLNEKFGYKILVLQLSKEILAQNYEKYTSYGFTAGIWSASHGRKDLDTVTFSTIGSCYKNWHEFKDYQVVIVDECHSVSNEGMFAQFFDDSKTYGYPKRVIGLSASLYRMNTTSFGTMLKFLTRSRPRTFDDLIYYINSDLLISEGYLMPITYYTPKVVDRSRLELNSTMNDYTDESVHNHFKELDINKVTLEYCDRILNNKKDPSKSRKNLLVFCRFIEDAIYCSERFPNSAVVSSKTPAKERDRITQDFKDGKIKCVFNVLVYGVGFDMPQLETILDVSPTNSLSRYYQKTGRLSRIHPDKKDCWLVDLTGTALYFGDINQLRLEYDRSGKHTISGVRNGVRIQLTNKYYTRN